MDWTASVHRLLDRSGPFAGMGFEPGAQVKDFLHSKCKLLIVGAGGLGCELLKDCALLGFRDIHVVDMDTIDVSNLNRQFLFRRKDVGASKAEVAARFIMERIPGVSVTPYFGDLKDKDEDYYRQFNLIICGLDSIEARRWINSTIVDMVALDDDGSPVGSTIIPIIDGGTEGFKGQARVIIPRLTACFECTLELFPPRTTYPICTIANTPRLPEHCIEWASELKWKEHFQHKIDTDNPDHIQWLFETAKQRAADFNITGVTYRLTQGVVKNIIPAIASTNAIISAACANEAFKIATQAANCLDNYMMYSGGEGLYTYTFAYEKKPNCPVCGTGVLKYTVNPDSTLESLIDRLLNDSQFQMKAPSLTVEGRTLYMQSPPSLEQMTRINLEKPLHALMQSGERVRVSDAKLPFMVTVEIVFG